MIIHYTYRDYTPVLLTYDMRYKDHVWVNMHMKGFLTPTIVHDQLYYWLEQEPPAGLVEAILTYPDMGENGKDVTVVF